MDVREFDFWESEAEKSRIGKELAQLVNTRLAVNATGDGFKKVTDSIQRKLKVLNGEDVEAEEKRTITDVWDAMKRKGRG